MSIFGWGTEPWGGGSWGGGFGPAIELAAAQPIRENLIRLAFSTEVYFSNILDPKDAAEPSKYVITEVPTSIGLDGEPARPVAVVKILKPTALYDGIDPLAEGRLLDVILDRPLSPFPAEYSIRVSGVYTTDKLDVISETTLEFYGLYRQIQRPEIETVVPLRDFANPQSILVGENADAVAPNLGTFSVDSSGDYSVDQGLAGLKKRIVRRLITIPGGFAHLPNYGVGVPQQGKRLARSSVLAAMAANAEVQILKEPDVLKARVRATADTTNPELYRFRVVVQMRGGKALAFDVPFIAR